MTAIIHPLTGEQIGVSPTRQERREAIRRARSHDLPLQVTFRAEALDIVRFMYDWQGEEDQDYAWFVVGRVAGRILAGPFATHSAAKRAI